MREEEREEERGRESVTVVLPGGTSRREPARSRKGFPLPADNFPIEPARVIPWGSRRRGAVWMRPFLLTHGSLTVADLRIFFFLVFRASSSSGFCARISPFQCSRIFQENSVLATVASHKNVGGSIERVIAGLSGRFLGPVGFAPALSLQPRWRLFPLFRAKYRLLPTFLYALSTRTL